MYTKEDNATFPTPVGMNRIEDWNKQLLSNVPHARGDEPHGIEAAVGLVIRSPRPWG